MAATSPSPATHPVPTIYRVLFTYIDPAFCTIGLLTHLFQPSTTLTGYSPYYSGPPSVAEIHVLDSMAGFFLMLGMLEAVLLRVRGRDVVVWRVLQGCVALLDWVMVFAAVKAVVVEGRTDLAGWRGDDWGLVVGNLGAGVLRTACAAGIGMGRDGLKMKKKI